jgi:hypothetical protein
MAVDPAHLQQAAVEMLGRYGAKAVEMAQERVESAARAGDPAALDLALMVLTEVERHQAAASSL